MAKPALLLLVKFKSSLPFEEVEQVARDRIEDFRALPGLTQKYYFQEPTTGEVGGLYLWASKEAFDEYRNSELRATIAKAYQVVGEPRVEVFRVFEALRD